MFKAINFQELTLLGKKKKHIEIDFIKRNQF